MPLVSRATLFLSRTCILAGLMSASGDLIAQPNRILTRPVNNQRFALAGHVHPFARSEYDKGPSAATSALNHVTLVFGPSDRQAAELDRLLSGQQDPTSPNYHHWLTPEAYAERFGASTADVNEMVAWLQSQQLTVTGVARARNAITVSGTAAQVGAAFHTEIHVYDLNGEIHYANASDPSLPVAFHGVVKAIRGLHDFRMKPKNHKLMEALAPAVSPAYTSSTSGNHYLAPDDYAVILNFRPLYSTGIDGTGQKIAIVGQSQIDTSHLSTFRSYFGLPTVNLTTTLVPNTQDPGSSESDAQESDLDLQWASSVARKADLIFVYSYDVTDAVRYAIDQNLAPVLSMSYGECETSSTRSDAATMQTWAKQANAQGITWVAASGDSGAADCYQGSGGPFGGASTDFSLATDLPASVPEVTGIGGTEFSEGSGAYWNSSNNATTKASALSYIPEVSWNDSTTNNPAASGGGASSIFSKPSWQTGTGVPNDGARDVPDLALPASADHDGYMVYTTSQRRTTWYVFGGTSVGAPTFSGMLALLNQYLTANGYQAGSGLGNVNTHLYSLAMSTPAAFHDVSTGNNVVTASTCTGRSCSTVATSSIGYNATPGYDQVTGLGSIDAYTLASAWHAGSLLLKNGPTLILSLSAATISTAGSTTLSANLGNEANAPTGTVSFSAGGTVLGASSVSESGGNAIASLTIQGSAAGLTVGAITISATYSGDASYSSATSTVVLTVVAPASIALSISGAANAASYKQAYAPGMVLSLFGTQLALTTLSASSIPLPTVLDNVSVTVNGAPAPLYYISPAQINVQVPYETPTNASVALAITNNGRTASTTIQISAAAPGIFTDGSGGIAPTASAGRGQTISLYITGAGTVQPAVSSGAVPAAGVTPLPAQKTSVTLGGLNASATYTGIPDWAVGVVQINFTVPADATLGSQSVVVTVGGVASAAATLTVNQ